MVNEYVIKRGSDMAGKTDFRLSESASQEAVGDSNCPGARTSCPHSLRTRCPRSRGLFTWQRCEDGTLLPG